jgi:hypothetical protein
MEHSPVNSVESTSAENEHKFHHYKGNAIPWYVRLLWLCFWVFVVAYAILYLFPAAQVEISNPP